MGCHSEFDGIGCYSYLVAFFGFLPLFGATVAFIIIK